MVRSIAVCALHRALLCSVADIDYKAFACSEVVNDYRKTTKRHKRKQVFVFDLPRSDASVVDGQKGHTRNTDHTVSVCAGLTNC